MTDAVLKLVERDVEGFIKDVKHTAEMTAKVYFLCCHALIMHRSIGYRETNY